MVRFFWISSHHVKHEKRKNLNGKRKPVQGQPYRVGYVLQNLFRQDHWQRSTGRVTCQHLTKAYLRPYQASIPTGIYLLKVNNINTKTRCEICSKLTIKTPERRYVFIVNFEHI